MERLDGGSAVPADLRGGIVALGNFDGFHKGHQAVVGRAVSRARSEGRRPVVAAASPRSEFEPTPIFRSVAHEVRERHDDRYDEPRYREARRDEPRHDVRYAEPRYDEARREERGRRAYPDIPAPHPGSGPFPAQDRTHRGPEPVGSAPARGGAPAASTEDELRRRAERRRRPRVEPESGRHALRH